MRAIVYSKSNVTVQRNHTPTKPKKGELLVKVLRAAVCSTDIEITKGYMGFEGILGHEFVGEVVEGPPRWKGNRVAAEINCVCGHCDMCRSGMSNHCLHRTVIGIDGRDGCFAESIVVPERNCHLVPDAISNEEAVFIEPLAAAYQTLHQVPIEPRTKVAVLGAGRLGLLMAQILTATKCDLHVIEKRSDRLGFCDRKGIRATAVGDLLAKPEYDVVVDCTGSTEGFELAMTLTRPRGTIVLKSTVAEPGKVSLNPLVINEIRVKGSRCGPFPEAINALARKEIDVMSMVSKTYPLSKGLDALKAAQDPKNLKILIDPSS